MSIADIGLDRRQQVGLLLGPGLFVLILLLSVPADLQPQGMMVAAVTLLMAAFWSTEPNRHH